MSQEAAADDDFCVPHGELMRGSLWKRGQVNTAWKSRYFVLYSDKSLRYFTNAASSQSPQRALGQIPLQRASTAREVSRSESGSPNAPIGCPATHCLEIVIPGERTWFLATDERPQFDRWIADIQSLVVSEETMRGSLWKRGQVNRAWKRRFVTLSASLHLQYFEFEASPSPLGAIDLSTAVSVAPDDAAEGRPFAFSLVCDTRRWEFAADSAVQRERWLAEIERALGFGKRVVSIKEGFLEKKGYINSAWKRRFVVLCKDWLLYFSDSASALTMLSSCYFSDDAFNKSFDSLVRGAIRLDNAVVEVVVSVDRPHAFVIHAHESDRVFEFAADQSSVVDAWIGAIRGRRQYFNDSLAKSVSRGRGYSTQGPAASGKA